jgi:tetratricopeptide (TPR) repeat protein
VAPHESLERAEWLVFHGAVAESLPLLEKVRGMPGRPGTYGTWLTAVALGACGRYGEALSVADSIESATPEYSMARSLRASLLRQLGCHDLALVADREAMATAATPGAAVEALTGLAADAVGMNEASTAATMLGQATSLLDRVTTDPARPTWWRHRVRVDWVRCEVALLQSQYEDAVEHAARALQQAEAANAPRHIAKSLLFLAVSRIEAGHEDAAVAELRRSLLLSTSMGFLAVAWPTHAVLAALSRTVDREAAHTHLVEASAITDVVRAGLTAELADRWDAREDIIALHRAAS